ncbi:MAG: hypothetical protein ACYC0X_12515 [Pirellulaceae bacterium]
MPEMDGLPPKSNGTQMEMTPEPITSRIRFVWLVAVHVVVGLLAGLLSHSDYGTTWRSAFSGGILLSQIVLLGIWGGLGGTVLWNRMIDVVLGLAYLTCLTKLIWGRFDDFAPIFVIYATVSMMFVMLIVRCITGAIYHDRSSTGATRRRQFSIRHLFVLTSVIACLTAIGKLVQPLVDASFHGTFVRVILCCIVYAVIGIIPMWSVLATKRPVFYGICVVAVKVFLAYRLGQIGDPNSNPDVLLIIGIATEATSVTMSLLVVRSWGYRLMPMPSRHSVVEQSPECVSP